MSVSVYECGHRTGIACVVVHMYPPRRNPQSNLLPGPRYFFAFFFHWPPRHTGARAAAQAHPITSTSGRQLGCLPSSISRSVTLCALPLNPFTFKPHCSRYNNPRASHARRSQLSIGLTRAPRGTIIQMVSMITELTCVTCIPSVKLYVMVIIESFLHDLN